MTMSRRLLLRRGGFVVALGCIVIAGDLAFTAAPVPAIPGSRQPACGSLFQSAGRDPTDECAAARTRRIPLIGSLLGAAVLIGVAGTLAPLNTRSSPGD